MRNQGVRSVSLACWGTSWGTELSNRTGMSSIQTRSHSHSHCRTLPRRNLILAVLVLFHCMPHSTFARSLSKGTKFLPRVPQCPSRKRNLQLNNIEPQPPLEQPHTTSTNPHLLRTQKCKKNLIDRVLPRSI
jgi:hypothetical protein